MTPQNTPHEQDPDQEPQDPEQAPTPAQEVPEHVATDQEPQEDTTPAPAGQDQEDQQPDAEEEQEAGKNSKANREAAKYRTQLRETEAKLESVTTQRDQVQAALVETQVTGMTPKLFWQMSDGPSEFFTDDGALDTQKIRDRMQEIRKDFGLKNSIDHSLGRETPPEGRRNSLANAFTPNH
ncbi:Snf7 family protein [Rothia halotolerans]|uniref:Snf7 family protein n=1 Tax=Rothia halotolerans TaxID=405770 RepID=UPI00101DC13E|nr:Snf7 family protein [Rothia halotolerans]